ncbi:MAG TPA: HAMP domain-containing sensor histidine kinase [Gemmatimonadaceae bacterium]|nr:HAMP domain-containing sensor histidine kinase [Gemmatimonadaceae bacterium]
MTLRSRLGLGLVLIAVILVGPLVWAIWGIFALRGDAKNLRERDFAASQLIGRLSDGLNDLRRQELALLFTPSVRNKELMNQELQRVGVLTDSLAALQLPDYARGIEPSVDSMTRVAPAEFDAAIRGDTAAADSLSSKAFVPALTRADSLVKLAERALFTRTSDDADAEGARITLIASGSVLALILAIAVAAGVAFWLTRSITSPILDLRAGMRAVADGDLTYRLGTVPSKSDEFGQLAASFTEMTRQLSELDKLKAEFVSVASHELKTPINVMIGYLQLLDEGVYGPVDVRHAEVHRTLVVQANTLARLVKQLLDVSRFEAGGGRLELRSVNLESMLAELERSFHVLAVQREVAFHVESEGGLPREVYWDDDRINEVLGNLLSNAFKFTPHGGTVSLTIEPDDGSVIMRVTDTGAGIPPEQLPRIFEKFYQADNQRARGIGTGLGLAIAKEIVEAHGGWISCESTLGVGTTFTIRLPVRAVRRSIAQRATPAIPSAAAL